MLTTAKITKKGQVTIPRKIRERLDSQIVEFAIVGSDIVMRPVKSVAGSLSSYAKEEAVTFKEAREKAWDEAVREQYDKKTSRR
jgi:AbrB family looped-hinge helix DNA binding protein